MNHLFYIFLILSLVGCQETVSPCFPDTKPLGTQVQLKVDARFTATQIAILREGLEQWKRATGVLSYKLELGYQTDCSTAQVLAGKGVIFACQSEEEFLNLKFYSGSAFDHRIILVMDRISEPKLLPVFLHELGHFYGLHHVKDGHSLMNRVMTPASLDAKCLDLTTIKTYCQQFKCN